MRQARLEAAELIEVPFVETAIEQISVSLKKDNRPTALICSNDLLAIRAIRAAHQCGLRVPQDISVTGFDGIQLGQDLTPAMSTISQPNYEMGRQSVLLLVKAINESRVPESRESLTLACQFQWGESCAQAPAPHCANT